MIGEELEKNPATRDLAATAFEDSVTLANGFTSANRPLNRTPIHRLATIRLREGRPDKARDAILTMNSNATYPDRLDAEAVRQLRMTGLPVVARELMRLGFAGDAVPFFQDCIALAEAPRGPSNVRLFAMETFDPAGVREELDRALNEMERDQLAAIAGRSISSAIDADQSDPAKITEKPRLSHRRDQALDLAPFFHPRELDKATVRSLVAESLATCNADQLAALDDPLDSLRKAHPDDLSVAITIALQALAIGDSHRIEPALARLVELVDKSPLEVLPAGTRANSRQRQEAARLIPLWLVARACRTQTIPNLKATGERLAARAFEAAQRQSEPYWVLAMIREQGQLALDHHDRNAALAAWSRMLDMVVTPEAAKAQRPRATRPVAAPGRPQPAATTRPAPPIESSRRLPAPGRTTGSPASSPIADQSRFVPAARIQEAHGAG